MRAGKCAPHVAAPGPTQDLLILRQNRGTYFRGAYLVIIGSVFIAFAPATILRSDAASSPTETTCAAATSLRRQAWWQQHLRHSTETDRSGQWHEVIPVAGAFERSHGKKCMEVQILPIGRMRGSAGRCGHTKPGKLSYLCLLVIFPLHRRRKRAATSTTTRRGKHLQSWFTPRKKDTSATNSLHCHKARLSQLQHRVQGNRRAKK